MRRTYRRLALVAFPLAITGAASLVFAGPATAGPEGTCVDLHLEPWLHEIVVCTP